MPDSIADIIENTDAQRFISVVSMFEFTIKYSLEKLRFEGGVSAFWKMTSANGFVILPISESHLAELTSLPFLHRDPFDRLMIATAIVENMTILTADNNIRQYDVRWVW
ncbi:MAG: type II toxin-antitoxin system VapC family toxin [Synergistaceae bacterium]|nr:type II toxin-antitoxin system VapC family toxin [Synergistaceae bacterium]